MYYIRYEKKGCEWYYIIYHKVFVFHFFLERWGRSELATQRLAELSERGQCEYT